MKCFRLSSLFVLAIGVVSSAHAWDDRGHRQIADIAYELLTPKAKQKLQAILMAGDAQFRPSRTGDVTTDKAADSALRTAFQAASVWSDNIKASGYNGDYLDELAKQNLRWSFEADVPEREREKCKTWHYYDVPIRFKGQAPKVSESNAVNATNFALAELAKGVKTGSPESKMQCFWLYWVAHVVGDLHQPLHCTSNYEVDHEKGDAGGNGVSIKDPDGTNKRMNLHSLWDRAITRQISTEESGGSDSFIPAVTKRWMADASLKPTADAVKVVDPMKWVTNGAQLADKNVYTSQVVGGFTPDAGYLTAMCALSKRQAVLAGYRLANVLNEALK